MVSVNVVKLLIKVIWAKPEKWCHDSANFHKRVYYVSKTFKSYFNLISEIVFLKPKPTLNVTWPRSYKNKYFFRCKKL